MSLAVRVEGLSKKYRLGARSSGEYRTLRESLTGALSYPWSRLTRGSGSLKQNAGDFWALKDVSFDVRPGEVVGIIGRNGAGKSTLLKVLSRITEPTSGRVVLRGRAASLLEVGTGFHPELTGRENIFLNGSILGMPKQEIRRKFDEIVDFAEVEEFLDTPVKRYSSGMYVRLAFAVAANLEPEILIVDEVLAVGDTSFQRKCTGKMKDVASSGRTVLFVSHNMGTLQNLCSSGLLIDDGRVTFRGDISKAIVTYLSNMEQRAVISPQDRIDRAGQGEIRLTDIEISVDQGSPRNKLVMGLPAVFRFSFDRMLENLGINFTLYDERGNPVSYLSNWPRSTIDSQDERLINSVACRVDSFPLRAGTYHLSVQVWHNRVLHDQLDSAATFEVEHGEYCGRVYPYPKVPGVVCIDGRWQSPDAEE